MAIGGFCEDDEIFMFQESENFLNDLYDDPTCQINRSNDRPLGFEFVFRLGSPVDTDFSNGVFGRNSITLKLQEAGFSKRRCLRSIVPGCQT